MPNQALQRGIELAEELRELAASLTRLEVSEDDVREALALARSMAAHLRGPERQRWYEQVESPVPDFDAPSAFHILSPVSGLMNPVAPPLVVERTQRPDGQPAVLGRTRLSSSYEGPPHGVHGGIVAALFDEVLGAAQGLAPPPGVTAKLEVRYRHLTPVDEDLRVEGWIVEQRDRRVFAEATCHAGETLTASATALFLRVDFEAVQAHMQARREQT
ncbi:MAG: PaaI family thioesterase [Myxococcales bacterium]|nr:PaaI family thioesterase [Myxococcales bacterium]